MNAISNCLFIENRIFDLLGNLVVKKSQKTENIHLIGFSLGAQLMGKVGRKMKDKGRVVDRITGRTKRCVLVEQLGAFRKNFSS